MTKPTQDESVQDDSGVPPPALAFDLNKIESLLNQSIGAASPEGQAIEPAGLSEQINEFRQRLERIEATQATLQADLKQLGTDLKQEMRAAVAEIGSMKTELVGDRKALSALSIFNGAVGVLDSLRAIRDTHEGYADPIVSQYVDTLIDSLTIMLRGLGFTELDTQVGDLFDPVLMECTEYDTGEEGVVLGVTRIGYRTQVGVIRPVGVRIANPTLLSTE